MYFISLIRVVIGVSCSKIFSSLVKIVAEKKLTNLLKIVILKASLSIHQELSNSNNNCFLTVIAVTKNELDRISKEYNNKPNTKANKIGFGTHIPKDSCASSITDHEDENRTWRGIHGYFLFDTFSLNVIGMSIFVTIFFEVFQGGPTGQTSI